MTMLSIVAAAADQRPNARASADAALLDCHIRDRCDERDRVAALQRILAGHWCGNASKCNSQRWMRIGG